MGAYDELLCRAVRAAPFEPVLLSTADVVAKPTAGDILKEAHDIVEGARNATHGEKERSFQVIANFWNTYLDGRKEQGPITAFDTAQLMVLLKIARSIQGARHKDHALDAAGYSAIAGELM